MDELESVGRLIGALTPWLDELVIVGGSAHRLYRFHPLAEKQSYQALRTRDSDIAFAQDARLSGNMAEALKAAGFHEEFSSDNTPPVSTYRLGDEDMGFFAEFLTPRSGSGVKRDGSPDATMAKSGVTAQKLRHLELLLVAPWTVEIVVDLSTASNATVRLPNPASFIAQKLLIQKERPARKQAQDILYLHDTLELFGRSLDSLREIWAEDVRPTLTKKIASQIGTLADSSFRTVTDAMRTAVLIPQDRNVSAEQIRAVCELGARRIFLLE